MRFDMDPSDAMLGDEVRGFVSQNLPSLESSTDERDCVSRWTRLLHRRGWLVPHWPVALGGLGWSPIRRYEFEAALVDAGAPPTDRIALDLAGPVICSFGTALQRDRYISKMFSGDEFWCQGFSEPHAGSDVNSLRTVALREGNHYVVNGQKLWTTNAHLAHMMFALVRVRSRGSLQPGLSFLLIDMRSRGIRVRPVATIDGRHHLNEVFIDDVRVPIENLIGEEGKGWMYARFLLGNERPLVASLPNTKRYLKQLNLIADLEQRNGRPLAQDPDFRMRLAKLEVDLAALEFAVLRAAYAPANDPNQEVLGPVLKIRGGELRQRVSEMSAEALGDRALINYALTNAPSAVSKINGEDDPPGEEYARFPTREFLFNRSATLAGGTSEIQRNIIAGVGLGL
jgi:alkylation response protein AidB-like acyl-CoA dehydrogenase